VGPAERRGSAWGRAEADDKVRVVILGGTGDLFSSGHDLGSKVAVAEYTEHPTSLQPVPVGTGPSV
jgi:enoyl-CoA hydratase